MAGADIFLKGDYKKVASNFRTQGAMALAELSNFQETFGIADTDTTVNTIRDAIVSNYLGFDLINMEKHGFDAKKIKVSKVFRNKAMFNFFT